MSSTALVAPVTTVGARPARVPGGLMSLFSVPLGLAGLAGVWQVMADQVSAPSWPARTLFAVAATVWASLTVAYVAQAARSLTAGKGWPYPVSGPFAAYIPVVGLLLSSHYREHARLVVEVVVIALVTVTAVLAALLVSHWLDGRQSLTTFQPSYLLPTVAGAFIASIALSQCRLSGAAVAAFGAGTFFWLVLTPLIFLRLFTAGPLPAPGKPSLALLVSPPATGSIAWFLIAEPINVVGLLLLGLLAVMVLVPVAYFARQRDIPLTANVWAFTFPLAASTNVGVRWLSATGVAGWRSYAWGLSCLTTTVVAAIALATLTQLGRRTDLLRIHRPPTTEPGDEPKGT